MGITQRFMLSYSKTNKPLKIEISLREREISSQKYNINKGIAVYNIDDLAKKKVNAYQGRDKLRDLYDVCFLINNYFDSFSEDTLDLLTEAFQRKGLEHFDYIVSQQKDSLIDPIQLGNDFLKAYDKLGLLKFNTYKSQVIENGKLPNPKYDLSR